MKQLLIAAVIAASTIGAIAVTSQAQAGYRSYALEYCQYYKTRAMYTGDKSWWDAYYACLKDRS